MACLAGVSLVGDIGSVAAAVVVVRAHVIGDPKSRCAPVDVRTGHRRRGVESPEGVGEGSGGGVGAGLPVFARLFDNGGREGEARGCAVSHPESSRLSCATGQFQLLDRDCHPIHFLSLPSP
jgi:hypothetical protein